MRLFPMAKSFALHRWEVGSEHHRKKNRNLYTHPMCCQTVRVHIWKIWRCWVRIEKDKSGLNDKNSYQRRRQTLKSGKTQTGTRLLSRALLFVTCGNNNHNSLVATNLS